MYIWLAKVFIFVFFVCAVIFFFVRCYIANMKRASALIALTTPDQIKAQKAWLFASRWGFSLGEADDIYEHFCEDTGESSFAAFS